MDVDAWSLPHMAHGEADSTAKVLNVRDEPSLQGKVIGSLRVGHRVIVERFDGGRLKASGPPAPVEPGIVARRDSDRAVRVGA